MFNVSCKPLNRIRSGTLAWMLVASLSIVFSVSSHAVLLVEYDITNANAGTSNSVGIAAANPLINASSMTAQGALGTPFNFAGTFCYLDWPTGGALDPTKYFDFVIGVSAGSQVTYQNASFAVASGGSGTGNWALYGSTDGFSSSNILLDSATFAINATWQSVIADISALGTQTDQVSFRFYMFNMPSSGFSGLGQNPVFGQNGQNFLVNGDITDAAVPEPTTLALFGLGLAGLGFARRKQR